MIGLIFLFIGILAQLIINQDGKNIRNENNIKEKIYIKPHVKIGDELLNQNAQ